MKSSRLWLVPVCTLMVLSACSRKPAPGGPLPGGAGGAVDGGRAAGEAARAEEARRLADEERRREAARRQEVMRSETLARMVFFDFDSYGLDEPAQRLLDAVVPLLTREPWLRIQIEGHADDQGSDEYNLVLGMHRATAARDYLAAFGIAPERLPVLSFGEERPRVAGRGEEARASNRRAELRALGGNP